MFKRTKNKGYVLTVLALFYNLLPFYSLFFYTTPTIKASENTGQIVVTKESNDKTVSTSKGSEEDVDSVDKKDKKEKVEKKEKNTSKKKSTDESKEDKKNEKIKKQVLDKDESKNNKDIDDNTKIVKKIKKEPKESLPKRQILDTSTSISSKSKEVDLDLKDSPNINKSISSNNEDKVKEKSYSKNKAEEKNDSLDSSKNKNLNTKKEDDKYNTSSKLKVNTINLVNTDKQKQNKELNEDAVSNKNDAIWVENSDGSITTRDYVKEGVEYTYKDTKVKLVFSKITKKGYLTIKQIKLSKEQAKDLDLQTDTVYDITSTMPNGSFRYNLTLPISKSKDVKVVYAKDINELVKEDNAKEVQEPINKNSDTITIKNLNHFTVFAVVINPTPPPYSNLQGVVDDSSTAYSDTGSWNNTVSCAGNAYNNTGRYANNIGANEATWEFKVPYTGFYDISFSWIKHANQATNAKYTIYSFNGSTSVKIVNQKGPNCEWSDFVSQGIFKFKKGITYKVVLTNAGADGNVFADAIKITSVGSPQKVYVNDDWSTHSIGDTFTTSGGKKLYYGYNAFSSIQTALNAVKSGGKVVVFVGTYNESLIIDKPGVTLTGKSRNNTIIRASSNTYGVYITADNVTINKLSIKDATPTNDNTSRFLVKVSHASGFKLYKVNIVGQGKNFGKITGLDFNSTPNVTLNDVKVSNFSKNGIAFTAQYKPSSPLTKNVTIKNVFVNNNGGSLGWAGIAFYTYSGANNAANITNVSFLGANTLKNNAMGLYVEGDVATAQTVGTVSSASPLNVGNTSFDNNVLDIVNYQSQDILALTASFNGKTGQNMTFTERKSLSDTKLYDYRDNNLLGKVIFYTLEKPTLLAPANNSYQDGATLVSQWSLVNGATKYLYNSYNDSSASSLRYSHTYTTTSKTANNVNEAVFWWRVKAQDDLGEESPWSDLWKVTIDNTPPLISGLSPSDGLTLGGTTNPPVPTEFDISDNYGGNYYVTVKNSSASTVYTSNGIYLGSGHITNGTWDFTSVSDGTYTYEVYAVDNAGHTSNTVINTVKVDNTPPTTSITNINDNSYFRQSTIILEGTTTDATSAVFGVNIYWATYNSSTNQCGSYTKFNTFIGLPTILYFPMPGDDPQKFNWSYNIDFNSIGGQGSYCFKAAGQDLLGNLESSAIVKNVVYDVTPPVVTWVNPTNGAGPLTGTVTLQANCDGTLGDCDYVNFWWYKLGESADPSTKRYHYVHTNGTSFIWDLNSSAPQLADNSIGTKLDGTYILRAAAKDLAGNYSQSEIQVTFDNTAPSKPENVRIYKGHSLPLSNENLLGCNSYTNTPQITIAWDQNPEADIDYYWFGTKFNSKHAQVNYPQNYYLANMTPGNNPYYYTVIAVDNVGLESPISDQCSLILDQTNPVVSITSPTSTLLSGTVDVRGTVTDNYPDHYWAVVQNSSGSTVSGPGVVYNNTSFTDELLFNWDTTEVPDGDYTIKLEARDKAGNKNSQSVEWLEVTVDNTAPSSTITNPSNSGSGSTVVTNNWDGSILGTATDATSSVSEVLISIQRSSDSKFWNGSSWVNGDEQTVRVSATGTNVWSYNLPSSQLLDDIYTIKSHAIDAVGNVENTYTLQVVYDITIPQVSLTISPSSPNGENGWYVTQPSITLKANDNYQVDYIQYQFDSTSGSWLTYSSAVTVSDGSKKFYYRAVDKAGNISDIGLKNVKVDTVAPNRVGKLEIFYNKDDKEVKLKWKNEDSDIYKVYIYKGTNENFDVNNDTLKTINTKSDEDHKDTDVKLGKEYFYKLVTKDEAGNFGKVKLISIKLPKEEGEEAVLGVATNVEQAPITLRGAVLGANTQSSATTKSPTGESNKSKLSKNNNEKEGKVLGIKKGQKKSNFLNICDSLLWLWILLAQVILLTILVFFLKGNKLFFIITVILLSALSYYLLGIKACTQWQKALSVLLGLLSLFLIYIKDSLTSKNY